MIGVGYLAQCPEALVYHHDAISKAIESFQSFIEQYPGHPKVNKAKEHLADLRSRNGEYLFNIGEYYFRNEGALDAAAIYFGRIVNDYSDTCWGGKAQEKLSEIEEIKMRINEEGTKK